MEVKFGKRKNNRKRPRLNSSIEKEVLLLKITRNKLYYIQIYLRHYHFSFTENLSLYLIFDKYDKLIYTINNLNNTSLM